MSVNFEELYDEFLFFAPPASSAPTISPGIMAEPHTPSPSPLVIYEGTPGNGIHQSQQLQQQNQIQQQPFYPPATINQHHNINMNNMNNLAPGGYNHPPSHIHHHLPNQQNIINQPQQQQQQPQQQQQQSLLSQQLASNSNGNQTYSGHQQQSAGMVYENSHMYQIRQQPFHANYHIQPPLQQQQQQVHHQIAPQQVQQQVQRPQQQGHQQHTHWFQQPHVGQPFVPQNVTNNTINNGPLVDHPQLYPGGLEILWRELPLECQRLIEPQDVPDTARFRGYFTVCELIALKRTLQLRYAPVVHQQLQQQQQLQLHHQQQQMQQQQNRQMQAQIPQQNVATTTNTSTGVTNTSSSTSTNNNLNGIKTTSGSGGKITKSKKTPHAQTTVRVPTNQTQQQISASVDHAVREALISLGQGQGGGENSANNKQNQENKLTIIENSKGPEVNVKGDHQSTANDKDLSDKNQINEKDNKKLSEDKKEGDSSANILSTDPSSSTSLTISNNSAGTGTGNGNNDKSALGLPSTLTTAPNPPYRTASLVFKLLQIGNYNFRTFSDNNPNKLRIIFNSQKISYECQLPMIQPPRDTLQPLRKLLMIDVSFDQITMIKFGTDKLFLRVEGPPLLTVTYHPSSEPYCGPPPLTPQDVHLLEQIDKGQLKLNPYHQLFFLNERLVHLLECQFKEHPRFKHLMENSDSDKAPI